MGGIERSEGVVMGRPAFFLDRDGVINEMVYDAEHGLVDSPQNVDQFVLLPGAADAVRLINDMGYLAIVVSNQPGIAKGKCTEGLLEAITDKMRRELARCGGKLDGVYYCLHHPQAEVESLKGECECRKPRPGLLLKAIEEHGITPADAYMVGDGLTDILAGKAAGCRTILIGKHKCDLCETMDGMDARPDMIVSTLLEAVRRVQAGERR